jgi:methionyl-tRNA formyltransferase
MIKSLIDVSPSSIKYSCIVIVPSRPKKMSQLEFVSYQLGLFGTTEFGKLLLLYCWKKFLNGISHKEYSVVNVARKRGIPITLTNSLKDQNLLKALKSYSPDVILSIASSRIFGRDILSIPKIASLNVHAGMLPKYRGINPSFWALLNQEKESAVTVHYMNEKIDEGDIIAQNVFSLENMRSLHQVYLKVLEIAPQTVVTSFLKIIEGDVSRIRNDSSISSYYSFPTKADGRKFRSLGLTFL